MSFENDKDDLSPNMDTINQVQKGAEIKTRAVKKSCSCGRDTYDKRGVCISCQNKK